MWNRNLNGILLTDNEVDDRIITPPRPVFFEELALLGFNKFWDYPKVQEPLLWAIGRRYYYRGELVAEAKGGNIFEPPKIVITEKGQNLKLEPIDIKKVIEKNKEALFVLENEALDFIEHTYKVYKRKNYLFAVSYSGGKDSQVVLDLVTRVIPPDELVVIFSDTTMEISYTYENVEKTREEYEKRYPGLKFYVAKPPKPAIEFWKDFGPPSRIHRWCCTVIKTAPFHKAVKSILNKENRHYHDSFMKILVFEGVRSDESAMRSKYERIRRNIKHFYQINAEVIHNWNSTEVFLYLFLRKLYINKGYRYGLDRVGCSLCPFASQKSEYILYKIDKKLLGKFIDIVYDYGKSLSLSNKEITEFIADGQWKKRAGGIGLDNNGTALLLSFEKNKIEAVLKRPRENILEWLKTVGDLHYNERGNNITGEIRIRNETLPFTIKKKKENEKIWISTGTNTIIKELLEKALYKSTYCVHCGACVEECPSGALIMNSFVKINTNLCTHCGNCLNFVEKGCLAAKSLTTYGGKNPMKKDRIATSKFQTFGLRRNWLVFFLQNLNNWFSKTNLGNRQIDSLKVWLRESGLLDKNNKPTTIAQLLSKMVNKCELLVWEIVWTNLYYNVNLIRWYLDTIEWGINIPGKDLVTKLLKDDSTAKEKTAKNAISSLLNLFDCSPIGYEFQIGIIEKRGRERYVKKIGTDDIHPLAVAYSLYKAAEHIGRRDFTVSELYTKEFKGGPYKLFGISKDKLERILRGLQEDKEQILRVDLVADLDNIYLRDDLSSLDIVKIAEARLK